MSTIDNATGQTLPEPEYGFQEVAHLFRAGAVPREADYGKLIEYVHYLHKLLGIEGEEGHTPALGPGLTTSSGGVLEVDGATLAGNGLSASGAVLSVGAGSGISVSSTQVSVNGATLAGNGLSANGATLAVGAGSGISVSSTQVSVNGATLAGNGLVANGAVLSVGTGEGISVTADKVGLHFNATIGNNSNKNGGLGADTEGLYVRLGVGSTRRGLYAYAGTNNEATLGVYADESHFKFASGNGILQLKSSVMLQPGMISMFAGTAIPDGWELCDGKNKTPDLSARFIASARAEEPDVVYIIKASTEA
ncbi:hypothetical protein FA292_30455 [Pseudomonas aeruginosa]|nr:hypothetical protein [Pseudomonas aeruginosa]